MSNGGRLAVIVLILLRTPAASATDNAARRCQDAIAGAGRRILVRALAQATACGSPGKPLACATVPGPPAASIRRPLARACGQQAPLTPAGDCDGLRTPTALAACLVQSHAADAVATLRPLGASRTLLPAGRRCRQQAARAL